MDTTRTGGPAAAAPKPVECTGEAAVTNAISMPSGGGPPPAIILAIPRRLTDATKSAYSPTVWTNTPRSPEHPPDTRHT